MRVALLLAITCLAATVAGCSNNGMRTFSAEFPADGERDVDALAVSLVDQTGLVTAIAVAPPDDVSDGPVVRAQPGIDDELRVSWLGDGCDRRLTVVFGELGDGYDFAIHVDPTAAGGLGCPDVRIPRALLIAFSQPIDATAVTVSRPFP